MQKKRSYKLYNNLYINIFLVTSTKIGFFIFLCSLFIYSTLIAQPTDKEKIVLQLKWKNQFQFAGYYAAIEKGFYRDAGLLVEVREPEKEDNVIDLVLSGKAQYGIGGPELVVRYMQGAPIVVLACILQNSPSVVITKTSSNILTPKDLKNKNIEINKDESGIEVLAMLLKEGITSEQIHTTPNSFSLNNLLSNKSDAIEAYTSNEPFFLEKFGIPFRVINPNSYGINFYSDCIFTTRDEIDNHSERANKFRKASIQGWEYALNHPEEIAQIIQSKYRSIKTIDHLLFEAEELRKLVAPEFVQIGHSNKERWLNIVETLSQLGLISNYRDINGFVYDPDYNTNQSKVRLLTFALLALITAFSFVCYLNYRAKSRLKKQSEELKTLLKRYEHQLIDINRLNSEVIRSKNKIDT